MSRRTALAVSALLAAGLAVAAFVVVPHGADQPMTVTAQFEDVIGLYEGNDVSVLGMPVGKVTSIVPKSTYVEVKMAIDSGVDLPADVQAVTVSTSILTDRHIELTPAYRSGPKLRTGDLLGLPRTRTPVEFDRTLAMVDKLSSALRGDDNGDGPLADLVDIGAQIGSDSGPNLAATLDQLSQALRLGADNGAGTKQDIEAIASNLAELTRAAADNDATIREFGSNIRQFSAMLAEQDLGDGDTGAKINQILDEAAALLETNRDGLKSTVANSQTVLTAADDNRRDIAEMLDLLPMLGDNVYNAIDSNVGAIRAHALADKLLANQQMVKEICNLSGIKDLGCATGTLADYSPDFGVNFLVDGVVGMLETMAGAR